MDVGFAIPVNKSSGTLLDVPGSSGAGAPGFMEQIKRVMRDNDRQSESPDVKKPAVREKTPDGGKPQAFAKAGETGKTSSSEDNRDCEYVENMTFAVWDGAAETAGAKPALIAGAADTGFISEAENAEISAGETAYMFVSAPEPPVSFGFRAPDGFDDFSVSSSAETRSFPTAEAWDSSGFTAAMDVETAVENLTAGESAAAVSGAVQAGKEETVRAAFADGAEEGLSGVDTARAYAASAPPAADVNVSKKTLPFSGDGAANGAEEPGEPADGFVKLNGMDFARPAEGETVKESAFSLEAPSAARRSESARDAAAPLRGEAKQNETLPEPEYKTTADDSLPGFSDGRAAGHPSSDDALSPEWLSAQAAPSREGDVSGIKTSENSGKTAAPLTGTSVQAVGTEKTMAASTPVQNAEAPEQEFVFELAGRIKTQVLEGREVIRLQLRPENLGHLEIRAESGRSGLAARITTESADVKNLLESNLHALRQTLEERGLKVDRIHIVVGEGAGASGFAAGGGRYGHAGTGPREEDASVFSGFAGAKIKSPNGDERGDSSASARRGVGFYTVG